jgi:hypothetical protein
MTIQPLPEDDQLSEVLLLHLHPQWRQALEAKAEALSPSTKKRGGRRVTLESLIQGLVLLYLQENQLLPQEEVDGDEGVR